MDRRHLKARVTPWGVLVCLVAVLSTGAAQSFAAASQADTVLSVHGRISLLAADGKHAAVTTTVKRACARRIVVWSAPGRRSVSIKPGILGCAGDGVTQLAVGGGWMALAGADALTIRSASGGQVATVPTLVGNGRPVALAKARLAIETTSTLDLYDPATGARGKSFSLGPAAALPLAGVTSKLALLRGPHRLVLGRLSDGQRISFPLRAAAAPLVRGRVAAPGLFYAPNAPRP